MTRLILLAGFLLGLIPALGVKPAYACDCDSGDPRRSIEYAELVVIGTPHGMATATSGSGGRWIQDPLFVAVKVHRYLKGSGASELLFATSRWEVACGAVEALDMGERHVLFLKAEEGGYSSSLCSGNAPLTGVSFTGVKGEEYLREVEAVTGSGFAPAGGSGKFWFGSHQPGFLEQWGFLVFGAVAAAAAGALVIRLSRAP